MTNETPQPPRYPYVHVLVPIADVEIASMWLWELGASGVEERDITTVHKPDQGAEPGVATLVGSFADDQEAQAAVDALQERWPARLTHVVGDDWRYAFRAYFKPLRVGRRLVIRPSWEAYEAAPDDVVLTLDPGGAFGTGTHESTRLALTLLEAVPLAETQLLDVGCGSGILAVAALLLGGQRALAIDVDPAAVAATEENAANNALGQRVVAATTPVEDLVEQFPLVLANIEAHVLMPLAAPIAARVAPGGRLILSGILCEQTERVLSTYGQHGAFAVRARRVEGDWEALLLQRADG